jgi:hypothetical protein
MIAYPISLSFLLLLLLLCPWFHFLVDHKKHFWQVTSSADFLFSVSFIRRVLYDEIIQLIVLASVALILFLTDG